MRSLELHNQRISDPEVLQLDTDMEGALLTFNRKDFFDLHYAGTTHAGINACKEFASVEQGILQIDEAIRDFEDLSGQLVRVNKPNA